MYDQKRRDKISQTGLIVGLTGIAISCGHLIDRPAYSAWGIVALALSVVGVILGLIAVIFLIWRSNGYATSLKLSWQDVTAEVIARTRKAASRRLQYV
jgi:hypothetical protein